MTRELLGAGQVFAGRYRIERFLAEGGFGAVYVAEQLATEARVAVKVLWPHVLQAKDAVEKFEQEARIAGRVNSEHIVRVVDAGFDPTTEMPFLVMELLVGDDLGRLVESHGALHPELVVEYLRQTASALDRAHAYKDKDGVPRPIVHRDLKPENLFVARRDNGETVIKVLDFGIAKVLGATSNVSQEVKGTPLYMAFEQAGVGAITPRTDVWALGLIAFFLLTARSYWRAAHNAEASLTQLFGEVLSLPIDPASQRAAELGLPNAFPPGFDAWFSGCVNRDPNLRYASAGAAIAGLAEVYGIVPVGSRSAPSYTGVPGSALGSASQAAPVAAAVTGQSPSGPEASTLLSARPPGAATETSLAISGNLTPTPKKSMLPLLLVLGGGVLVLGGVGAGVALTRTSGAAASSAPASATPEAPPPPPPTLVVSATAAPPSPSPAEPAEKPATAPLAKSSAPATKPSASAKPAEPPPTAPPTAPPTKPPSTKPGKDPSLYGER